MEIINLSAKTRKELGKKSKALREKGLIPAIIYGYKTENTPLEVERTSFKDVFHKAGSSTLVNLAVDEQEPQKVLILEPQTDPISGDPIHVDFYKVRMDQKIKTEVPLEFIGESKAVKELEGSLVTNKDHVEIECLPNDLISEIKVDISSLKTFEDAIHVKDLQVPENVTILDDAEEAVVLVEEPRSEEELAELEEEVQEDVEGVEVEGKKEEEGEEGEAAETPGEEAVPAENAPAPQENPTPQNEQK